MPEHNAVPDDESKEQPSLEDFGDPGAGGYVWEHDWPADEIITQRGIASAMYDEHGDEMGHVLMADFDGGHDGGQVEDDIADRGGINLLLESSPGSFHYYNLGMRPRQKAATDMLEMHGDPQHVANGWRLGRWTLRLSPKRRQGEEEYKAAPELRDVWYNETDRPQSGAHWKILRAWFEIPEAPFEDSVRFVGRHAAVEEYTSITDELKEEMWPENHG